MKIERTPSYRRPWLASSTLAIAALGLAIALLGACSDNARSCDVDDDCFGGETCVAGVCQTQSASNNQPNNSGDDTGPNPGDDAGSNNSGHDASSGDAGGDTAPNNNSNNGGGDTCEVDPFSATCTNDDDYDNEAWHEYDKFKDTSLGCYGSLDRPEDWSNQIDGQICYDETGDFFGLTIVPCESRFRLEVKLTVPEMCTESEWELQANVGGGKIECETDRSYMSARCERQDNVQTWTILVEPSNSVWSLYFGVVGSEDENVDAQFDYTLEAQVF